MKLEFEVYECLCEPKIFKINDVYADYNDFGSKEDTFPVSAYSYMCENMQFISKLPTQTVLDKYRITVDEYHSICDRLETDLSFGRCGWCV